LGLISPDRLERRLAVVRAPQEHLGRRLGRNRPLQDRRRVRRADSLGEQLLEPLDRRAQRQPPRAEHVEDGFLLALVYVVAHYFSLLVFQGQALIYLASDPLGKGWDLFGTADFRPAENVFSPNTIWYVQVGVLVVGHVLGLVLAHERAVALFSSARTAIRTQYAMLVLMVLYTCTGLWLLSSG
jgi:hypothetical protein